MPNYSLTVNGEVRSVDAPADMPLLWVLRDLIGLTGTKYSCGSGICGSCTVHLNGQATRSCVTPISSIDGQDVVTIEGLSADGTHPVQQAWDEHNVPQCGYCQAGQIMNAAAFLRENPNPTLEEINAAQVNNLCRCGTYTRIRTAIQRAAELSGR